MGVGGQSREGGTGGGGVGRNKCRGRVESRLRDGCDAGTKLDCEGLKTDFKTSNESRQKECNKQTLSV